MAGLLLPVGPRAMSSWDTHQRRTTPSQEPGSDWYCPIGTPVYAPADGRIYGYGSSIIPATGLWNGIDFTNGMRFRAMHYVDLVRTSGLVERGELIAYSGATGYGKKDWSKDPHTGGAHVHGTLWPTQVSRYGYQTVNGRRVPYTVDFMKYADLAATAGGANISGGFLMALTSDEQDDLYRRIKHLDSQSTGSDGQNPSIASRVIQIESQVNGLPDRLLEILRQVNGAPTILGEIRARVGVSDAQVRAIADAVVRQVGTPAVKLDYAAIAKAVNDDAARRMTS